MMQTDLSTPTSLLRSLSAFDPTRMWVGTQMLCDAAFAGRRVGTQEHARASDWVVDQLRHASWEVSTQEFLLTSPVLEVSTPLQLELLSPDGAVMRVLAHRTEFCEHPRSASHPDEVLGRAIRFSENTPMQGAWVILDAVPPGSALTEMAAQQALQGAVGILTPLYAGTDGYLVKRIMAGATVALPILSVRTDLLPALAGCIVRAAVPVFPRLTQGRNIVARLQGTGRRLDQAPLLIGAHYDAMGDDVGGLRLPGATDNAAAVSVLLELARVISHLPLPPRRSLLLMAFDAEEVGAQGSRVAASQFKEQGKTPLVINLDGAACLNEAVWVEAGPQTETLMQALDQAGRWLQVPLVLGNIASDHRQFSAAGFAALGLSVGAAKLHTPADTMELVQPDALRVAATLIFATIWQLAWNE